MASGVLLYLVFYIIAGMILQASLPELDQFYKGKIPAFPVIIYTQVLRGFIFKGIAFYIQQMVSSTPKWKYTFLVGLVFSMLGGVIGNNKYTVFGNQECIVFGNKWYTIIGNKDTEKMATKSAEFLGFEG